MLTLLSDSSRTRRSLMHVLQETSHVPITGLMLSVCNVIQYCNMKWLGMVNGVLQFVLFPANVSVLLLSSGSAAAETTRVTTSLPLCSATRTGLVWSVPRCSRTLVTLGIGPGWHGSSSFSRCGQAVAVKRVSLFDSRWRGAAAPELHYIDSLGVRLLPSW